ncbi:tripartite tricarboxylate transporter TctB family protein [Halanaerobium sp. MA284_MarDTE_T2]|uniref:tripartite tricarboxylate transporter TctB family protein n=1 Tax=Halanaerobium sp. MA284_MarDTE_T2 TaxID=2183913 RepID=UPI000E15E638|nr:tripartite tricarboxylate transporter TctB family protein [Halanaerobium sp. MA284_MarDTE_T2]RCW44393.1 putative tricarboxylic transport membrane protein [Halanaerobium sp. MA284_MarDTE_T2]
MNFKKIINGTILVSIIFFIIITVFLFEALETAPPLVNGKISPTFFPIIVLSLMYFADIVIFIKGFKEEKGFDFDLSTLKHPTWVVIVSFIYINIFKVIGFSLSTFLYAFSLIMIFNPKKGKIKAVVAALMITGTVYLLFEVIFGVRLPTVHLPKIGGIY